MANNKNMKMIYNNIIMTHQQNKQFNTYKKGLDLEFLREYCMEHGELHGMERGKTLEDARELSGLVKPSVIHLDNPNNIIK